jgi:multiple sugar transport system substrate-binding protein
MVSACAVRLIWGGPAEAKDITLRFMVPDWAPSRIMKELSDSNYHAPSGDHVSIAYDFVPWTNYYPQVINALASDSGHYNLVAAKGNWLGQLVEQGLIFKLNAFIDTDAVLKQAIADVNPAVLAAYASYPYRSSDIYGIPQMPDLLVSYFRRDLFCDASEQSAYRKQYKEKLPCTAEEMDRIDWGEFRRIGTFFKRKKGMRLAGKPLTNDFWGVAFQAAKPYDMFIAQAAGFIWQHGGEITGADSGAHPLGLVNAPAAVEGLQHYLSLLDLMPPEAKAARLDLSKIAELFQGGQLALAVSWIGPADALVNTKNADLVAKVGFAQAPGLSGPHGLVRWSSISGYPFVLSSANSDEQNLEALDFAKWWLSPDTQHAFAARGGQSAIESVYKDAKYLTYRPWNRVWAAQLEWQRDLWHIPQFYEFLLQAQDQLELAAKGAQDAKATLDNIARYEEQTLTQAGKLK